MQAFANEIPRYRWKRMLRRALDLAPSNALIDLSLMTPPMRALAQRIYFHRRGGGLESFESWTKDFAEQSFEPLPSKPPRDLLGCI